MKSVFKAFVLLALLLACAQPALADGGPHGGYAPATDACAGCHRTHTASNRNLLSTSSNSICESCHGPSGAGADTDVWDGLYTADASSGAYGADGGGLKGGGFVSAWMDTNDDGVADYGARPATSSHTFDGTPGILWGNGDLNSGAGPTMSLYCTNCHNPHGRAGTNGAATYRILRPIPTGSGAAAGVEIPDEASKLYTVASASGDYWQDSYTVSKTAIAQWCAQCHTRYLAGADSATTHSSDSVYTFRHTSAITEVSCLDCHVAHGTAALMGFNSGSLAWPDGSSTPTGDGRSSLLRLDNRGVCYRCHPTP